MLEPIRKLDIEVEFYHIDKMFRPQFNFEIIKQNEVFVFNNYFGICNQQVQEVAEQCKNLIIDNSQAFFRNLCRVLTLFILLVSLLDCQTEPTFLPIRYWIPSWNKMFLFSDVRIYWAE